MVTKAIQVDEKTAEFIHKICAETGMGEGEALRKILTLQVQGDKPSAQERFARIRGTGDNEGRGGMIDKMMELKALEKIGGDDKKDEGGLLDRETLKMMLQMQYLQQIFPSQQQQQPQQQGMGLKETIELARIIGGDGKKGGDEIIEKLFEYQKDQDKQRRDDEKDRMKHLENLMKDKEMDSLKKEMLKVQDEVKQREEEKKDELHERIDMLQNSILRLGQSEDPLTKQVETRLKEKLTDALTNAVSDFDITSKRESLTTEDGKPNVNKIIGDGFKTLNKYIDARAKEAPIPQQFQELTPEQVAEIQAQQGVPGVGDSIKVRPEVQEVETPQPEAQPEAEIMEAPSVEIQAIQPSSVEPPQEPAPEPSPEPKPKPEETKLERRKREKIERVKGKKS